MLQLVHINSETNNARSFAFGKGRIATVTFLLLTLLLFVIACSVYYGKEQAYGETLQHPKLLAWQQELQQQQIEVAEAKAVAQSHVNTLTKKVALLQAQILRLNALGERLVDISDLDASEFDFQSLPGVGGPEEDAPAVEAEVTDFVASLQEVWRRLDEQQRQFSALELLYRHNESVTETTLQGRPVAAGWISSYYGKRTDPFHGRQAWHAGIDIAGKEGSEVVAVASGIVVFAANKSGYGNLVEVDHGNGYVTRYAHNKEIVVQAGDLVEKGQALSYMGSTGRSTGPHVHFEVLKNGKNRNPLPYVNRNTI